MSEEKYMSDEEIVKLYKESKDKKEQIKILAELNGLKILDVKRILTRAGIVITESFNKNIDISSVYKRQKSEKAHEIKEENQEPLILFGEEGGVPEVIKLILEEKLEELEDRLKALREEKAKIESEYSAVAQYLINPFGISQA